MWGELPVLSSSAWSTLLLALVCSLLFIPSHYHPAPLFRFLIGKMATRLYDKHASRSYLVFSSLLLTGLITCCVLVLAYGLISFAEYPLAFELLTLSFFISNPYTNPKLKRVASLIEQQQKAAARDLITPFLRRETASLSQVGLIKALIENQSLSFFRYFFLPLLFFYALGFIAALSYCLLLQCATVFSKSTNPNNPFNNATSWIVYVVEFIPLRLFCLPLLLKPKTLGFKYLALYLNNAYNKNSVFLLSCLSGFTNTQLGGPAKYHGIRYSKTRIGPESLPQIKDLSKTKQPCTLRAFFGLPCYSLWN